LAVLESKASSRRGESKVARTAILLWKSEQGQDTVEYALLMGFICLVGAATFIGMGQMTTSIWSITNSRLNAANQSS
jgi:Flp pilus assembly pilin Flp